MDSAKIVPAAATTRIPVWQESRARRLAANLAYPLIWLLNRPAAAWAGRALYDLALRCNGIAINYPGRHGLSLSEERFLARVVPGIGEGVMLDIGANWGAYALEVRRLAPRARILAFEPHPRTVDALRQTLAGTGVEAVQVAFGDAEGTLTLHDFASADGSTQASLSRAAVGLYTDAVVEHQVQCTTVDAFLEERGIGTVDFMKVDTEGFDLNVLRGARRALAERRIRLIHFEFIPANIATGVRMRDFFDVLEGYRLYRLCLNGDEQPLGEYSVKHHEIYLHQNLIARPA